MRRYEAISCYIMDFSRNIDPYCDYGMSLVRSFMRVEVILLQLTRLLIDLNKKLEGKEEGEKNVAEVVDAMLTSFPECLKMVAHPKTWMELYNGMEIFRFTKERHRKLVLGAISEWRSVLLRSTVMISGEYDLVEIMKTVDSHAEKLFCPYYGQIFKKFKVKKVEDLIKLVE